MKIAVFAAALAVALTASAANTKPGVMIGAHVYRNGKLLSDPSLWTYLGKPASITYADDNDGPGFSIVVTPRSLGDAEVELDLAVYRMNGSRKTLLSRPKLAMHLGETGSVKYPLESGDTWQFDFVVTDTPPPAHP
jgi:hypothetical protein